MKTSDFDYELPPDLIAQKPSETRGSSRLMLCDRESGAHEHRAFGDIISLLKPGDLLVLNDTKVYPARLLGTRESGGSAEVMLLRPLGNGRYRALVRPGKKLQIEDTVAFAESELKVEIISVLEGGERIIELFGVEDIETEIDSIGSVPLPPYVQRPNGLFPDDAERYQTIYARHRGAVAAPTAGLHFTGDLLNQLKKNRVDIHYLTLHVGYSTFAPITAEDIVDHKVEKEDFSLPRGTTRAVNEAKVEGRRVVAVGTTVVRALESAATGPGIVKSRKEPTELFIFPGFQFKVIDALITNFHLPRSSLLALVAAFAGYDNVMKWYKAAVEEEYGFYSFGDAMFIR